MTIAAYTFADWRSGMKPPKGWDCADAVDDGWGKDELDAFMKATVRPWFPPNDKPVADPDGYDAPPDYLSEAPPLDDCAVEAVLLPPADGNAASGEQDGLRAGQLLKMEQFDFELEAFLIDRKWWIRQNDLSGEIEIHRPRDIVPMTDNRLAEIRFSVSYAANGKEPAKDKITDAIGLIAERNSYHPVKDYLSRLKWDGVPRLDTWLIDYAGAEDTDLNRAFSRKILCAAVRRVMQPGCKFDHALVLRGPQGALKSSLVKALCCDEAWFTDQLKVGADAKETIENSTGAWIVELAELDGLSRREANAVKSFITTVSDKARLSYARYAVKRPRQFVLIGTTNESAFLNDLTGNRRWWIVNVAACDPAGLVSVRDQLWAEALATEPNENLWLDEQSLQDEAAVMTGSATDYGPWTEMLEAQIPEGPLKLEAVDVWKLVGIDGADSINKLTKSHHASMKAAMAGLGFERKDGGVRRDGKNVRAYVRGDPHTAEWWQPGGPARDVPEAWGDF
ncbi:virulence-associated E family protein [Brucella intermedia]|uniref:virulence-associated E family protein n=1 Tax=Brucella intermedia TaxID=94625 RepID=UPI00178C4D4E|nr:virulence-associated E family protein [Brucella intermedia]